MTSEEILNIFFVECEESLGAAEQGLAACKAGAGDADTINAIFRAVHSIKGGAGAFGFAALQTFTHTFETLLSDVREEAVALTPELIDLLLRALDVLSDHVAATQGQAETPDDCALITQLEAAMAANDRENMFVDGNAAEVQGLAAAAGLDGVVAAVTEID